MIRSMLAAAFAIAAAVVLAVVMTPHAQADPADTIRLTQRPLTVYQLPAVGTAVSGLVVPGPVAMSVTARTADRPGDIIVAAPATPYTCSSSAAGMLVYIDYVNVTTGARGGTRVKPCPYFLTSVPREQTIRTGSGPVLLTIAIRPSHYSPSAGQPALPGAGAFIVP